MPVSLSSSSADSEPKFRVAICGAGIAGLVLAITIGKYDPAIPIDLYEAHDSIETAGAGITLWRQEILVELGLLDEFKQILTRNPDGRHGANVRRSDIPGGGYSWFQRIQRNPSSMHRQQMVAILEKNLPESCTIYPRKRLRNYSEQEQPEAVSTSSILLEFEDGTIATTDVLIGADGVRSAVRKSMFEEASKDKDNGNETDLKQYIEATFTGIVVYRGLIPVETLRKESPENMSLREMMAYLGKGKSVITYPIANGSIINFGAVVGDPSKAGTRYEGRWTSDGTDDKLAELYDDFEPDVKAIVKLCEKPSKWALHVVKPLPFCVRKKIALIGDACHAMSPHFGAGAGQAMEDAFVLGRLIAHPLTSLSRIPDALRIYEQVRLPVACEVASLSLSSGWLYAFWEPGFYDGTRRDDDLDEKGISAYERKGMEAAKLEIDKRLDWFEGLSGALQAWEEAESKLKALDRQLVE